MFLDCPSRKVIKVYATCGFYRWDFPTSNSGDSAGHLFGMVKCLQLGDKKVTAWITWFILVPKTSQSFAEEAAFLFFVMVGNELIHLFPGSEAFESNTEAVIS